MSRLQFLARDQWDGDVVAAIRAGIPGPSVERYLADGPDTPPMPNGLGVMLHHPRLAERYLAFSNVLLREGVLAPRLRELMVLRVAWCTRSSYEWVQHVRLSYRYDITAAEIEAIAQPTPTGDWTALESDLLAATDQLVRGFAIDDATWARLAGQLDETELTEMLFVVGTYAGLAMLLNGFEVPGDPGSESVPAPPLPSA